MKIGPASGPVGAKNRSVSEPGSNRKNEIKLEKTDDLAGPTGLEV
jgi:hypothetical protein